MGWGQRAPSKCLDAAADLHDFGRFVMPDDQVFDPMVSEAEGCHLWVCNLEAGDRLPSRQDSLTSETLMDPMFIEVELLSTPCSLADLGIPVRCLAHYGRGSRPTCASRFGIGMFRC